MKTINAELTKTRNSSGGITPSPVRLSRFENGFSIEDSQAGNHLKQRILNELSREFAGLNRQLIYQVVNEADSLAATTPFPALLLPALAEEKVRAASRWAARQQLIREQTLVLAA